MLELTVRLVASLAVVVGLLLLLARFGGRRFRGRSGDLVRVVHRQPLTRTSAVAVVAVGNRVLVLGTTEQQVSILTELDPTDLGDALLPALEEAEPATVPGSSFAEQLVARTATGGAHRAETTTRAPARTSGGAGARVGDGALAGSVLSAQTWRQALAAASGKAS